MLRLIILRILESYFRRPLLNLLPFIILTGVGIAFAATKEDIYMSHGGISVQGDSITQEVLGTADEGFVWGLTTSEQAVAEFNELFASDSIVRAIIQKTALEEDFNDPEIDPDDVFKQVREDVWATTIGENNFAVSAKSEYPEVSKQLVDATIDTFLNWNVSLGLSEAQANLDFWNEQVDKEKTSYDNAQAELAGFLTAFPEPVRGSRPEVEQLEIDRLKAVADDAAARYNEARDNSNFAQLNYKQSETAVFQRYLIIDAPRVPDEPETSLTQLVVTVAIFGIIGAILGLLGVFGGAFLDRTFRYPVDVRESLELPVLSVLPAGVHVDPQPLPQEYSTAPESPQIYRAKLTPNVEPPTLIIMPGEKAELEKIAQERSQHDNEQQYPPNSQERVHSNGVADHHLDAIPVADAYSAAAAGQFGPGRAARSAVGVGDSNGVHNVRNGRSPNEGDRPYTRTNR